MKNAVYVPNGVNLKMFRTTEKKNNEILNILFVGRLEKQKGLTYLVKGISNLVNSEIQFKLLLVGDGSEKDILVKQVNDLKLNKYISFEGNKKINQLNNYYKKADIFILPSIWEGLPLVILEAWASKLPVIATSVGGILNICIDNKNSLIVPPRNVKKLTNAIKLLLSNQKLRRKLSLEGNKLVEKKYSWEVINKNIELIYINL